MRKIIIILCVWISVFLIQYQQGFSQTTQAVVTNAVDLSVTVRKMPKDDRGTDVENINTITVDHAGNADRPETYNILYYLDGIYVEEFQGKTLPFSFTRNFKGQLDKAHEVRIDLEDKNLRIVGRKTAVINVLHMKAR